LRKESTARISDLSPEDIRRRIEQSNRDSYQSEAKYVYWENCALRSDYEFIPCPCQAECWCRRKGCVGHYRIKEILFDQFLSTYVVLWIPNRARNNVKSAVLADKPFGGRQRNAVLARQWLRRNWSVSLARARNCDKCGLCDPTLSLDCQVVNLYEAKNSVPAFRSIPQGA
jgi:hypothetical protein